MLKTLDLRTVGLGTPSSLPSFLPEPLLPSYHLHFLWEPHLHVCPEGPAAPHCHAEPVVLWRAVVGWGLGAQGEFLNIVLSSWIH
jgi:hypothetical protein